ncbi:CRISP/Allergen/PR-1 [Portunus trituberculatus]|uniref:CRISP/Allergen/PR-1 n=1 Tax=Portunus trituberculatus TaxID=210409 RepID=A0A5B7JDF9_PORTR|nr:CRISP/Allergen/PR-1 [Portunus trituberculatus]
MADTIIGKICNVNRKMKPEGEGTTIVPKGEENMEDEEKNKDYEKHHQNHTMLLPPNDDCNVIKTGISEEEKEFILELHNELRSHVSCTLTFNPTCITITTSFNNQLINNMQV